MYLNNCTSTNYSCYKTKGMNNRISLVADRDSGGQLRFHLSTWPIGVPSKQDTCMCHCQGDTA